MFLSLLPGLLVATTLFREGSFKSEQCETIYKVGEEETCDRSMELVDGCLLDEDWRCAEWAREGKCLDKNMAMLVTNTSISRNVKRYPKRSQKLAKCVATCTEMFTQMNKQDLLTPAEQEFARVVGLSQSGLDTRDAFGYRYDICNLSAGWTSAARANVLYDVVNAHLAFSTDVVPRYTEEGFSKAQVPAEVWKAILRAVEKEKLQPERSLQPGFVWRSKISVDDAESRIEDDYSVPMPHTMVLSRGRMLLGSLLLPYAEEWIGGNVDLSFSAVYGVRRYFRGSTMTAHTDVPHTHVISAIVNVDQSADSPWPLQIMGHEDIPSEVYLKPGELLWYESAKLPHARNMPFNGTYFDNMFFHYRPTSDNVSFAWVLDELQAAERKRSTQK